MSKIALSGNASGTGTFTLASPNSSTDRTLDLPDASGVIDRLNRAGNVLQVVQATFTNIQETTTSTSFVDTSVTASITPSSASNKVLVLISSQSLAGAIWWVGFAIKRNSTDIASGINYHGGTGTWLPVSISYLDSPNSTSSVTYTLRFKSQNGSTVYNGWGSSTGGSTQNIVLMEIAA